MTDMLQAYLEAEVQKMRDKSFAESQQITLGQLIVLLEKVEDKTLDVYFDFCRATPSELMSWRGIYAELAVSYIPRDRYKETKDISVSDFLVKLKEAVGKCYTGYKGGDFIMSESTPIWVDNYGFSSSTAIVGIIELSWAVIIETRYIES